MAAPNERNFQVSGRGVSGSRLGCGSHKTNDLATFFVLLEFGNPLW